MKSEFIFVLKIAIASFLLSVLIKYGGEFLPLAANNLTALVLVLAPSIILGIFLLFKSQQLNNK